MAELTLYIPWDGQLEPIKERVKANSITIEITSPETYHLPTKLGSILDMLDKCVLDGWVTLVVIPLVGDPGIKVVIDYNHPQSVYSL